MSQSYKNVYFSDFPQSVGSRSSLTLAFGAGDRDLYEVAKRLSSDRLRGALGYQSFAALQDAARQDSQSVNAFCLSTLRRNLSRGKSRSPYLPGLEAWGAIALDPLQATFAGGRDEPLHQWYPYLEGYSPAFVQSVLETYSPEARTVLDPFAGTGTTPLTAWRLGKRAYFCELNPVLQFVVSVKIEALRLADSQRVELSGRLLELAKGFGKRLDGARADDRLKKTYDRVFGKSIFFDPDVFEAILKCRTVVDEVGSENPRLARVLTVAVLRSLLPVSRLVRRGDVRFKKGDEMKRRREVLGEVREALEKMSSDIQSLATTLEPPPVLLLENSKRIARLPFLGVDATVTSPPYLNGTNYFRNTKLELWFLRRLVRRGDLAKYRLAAMTAGINDVTVVKSPGTMPPSAGPVVEQLVQSSYDQRIPRMVGCFASEMHHLLGAVAKHTSTTGTIAVDIGDSCYAGVRVPTHRFVTESLSEAGFELRQDHVLRQRRSRSQIQLSQRLLVFRRSGRRKSGTRERSANAGAAWAAGWRKFRETLPHQQGEFAKRNWGHSLHSLCSYQGKMKPALAAHLVRTFTSAGDCMLDPFSGVGTLPFEAALSGVKTWAFDISPPAVHITAGKVSGFGANECLDLVERLDRYLRRGVPRRKERDAAKAIRFNGDLSSYFDKRTFDEVLLARRYFLHTPPSNGSESLVFSCLLHILHGNRPYALSRRSHPLTPFAPSGPMEYRPLIPRLRAKVERSIGSPLPESFVPGRTVNQDATAWWPSDMDDLDAVITSPPFFSSTRFHLGNWMRLWFSGWEIKDFRVKPAEFVDERQKQSFEVYKSVLRQCRERMKPDGVVVLHLGASRKCDMADELAGVARRWFRVVDRYTECVGHCERHGVRDKGTTNRHQYLVLQ